jgi:two-component system sensor histidine kinase KdpD
LAKLISPKLNYYAALLAVAGGTLVLIPFRAHINTTTVALALLLVVLFVAMTIGSKPALLASVLAMFGYNFFFLPPLHTLTIADPQNWIALAAFFITSLAVGQLSARARRRAQEAEAGKIEIRRLYDELHDAFDCASEAEAIKRSEQLKSALLDAVTHDIRTPLTSIKASATLLLEDREETNSSARLSPDEQHAILEVITYGVDRLDRFVEGIVDLAQIEAGDLNLHRNWRSVDDLIEAALAQAEPLTQDHQVKILIPDELPIVRVDGRAVTEVIYTLLDNARKYAPRQTQITISARLATNDVTEIAVEDQGPGIPIQYRERVFERFFRIADNGARGHVNGFGVGLAIAKGIVEAHGGRIWIEDATTGSGARIVFTVPVAETDEAVDSSDATVITN